jgi:inactivated superfamily I helicase
MVLARQSIFFYTKFVLESRTEIRLSDIRPDVVRSLLQFCHDGQVDTCGTDEELLHAANVCQVTNLKVGFKFYSSTYCSLFQDLCEQRLCNSTTESNLVEHWRLAATCDAKKLADKCAQIHACHQQEMQQNVLSNLMSGLQLETSNHMPYIS